MENFTKIKFINSRIFLIVLIITLGNLKGFSQVTDSDIVKSLLGKNFYEITTKLDSLGVWYHMHLPEDIKEGQKVCSISDSKGSVKVYTFKLYNGKTIDEIKINFRHDSREQVEDAMKIEGQSAFHVGHYSTDIVFQWKK
jgi:hypothetical protein